MFIFLSSLHRELKRDEVHFMKPCVICDTMWLWSVIWWYVMWINAVILYQLVVPLCSVDKPPWWHLWYAFLHPHLTRPSDVAGIILSVPWATANKWLSHFWHPRRDLETLYCKRHKDRWALIDSTAFHSNPNHYLHQLKPISSFVLCIVLPYLTTPMCWGSILCVIPLWNPAGMKLWCFEVWSFEWTFKMDISLMNIWCCKLFLLQPQWHINP